MAPTRAEAAAGWFARLVAGWALAGGVLLLAIVALNLWSVLSDAFAGRPFPGTIELTEIGVAVAVFAFLPYCQITEANIGVDVFTARAGPGTLRVLRLAAAAVALGVGVLLSWRMGAGLVDERASGLSTAILQVPVWTAFVPIVASLALLTLAAGVSLLQALPGERKP